MLGCELLLAPLRDQGTLPARSLSVPSGRQGDATFLTGVLGIANEAMPVDCLTHDGLALVPVQRLMPAPWNTPWVVDVMAMTWRGPVLQGESSCRPAASVAAQMIFFTRRTLDPRSLYFQGPCGEK